MDMTETINLCVKVLSDWRVDFIALAVLLIWAALRYVGSVYRRSAPRRAGPSAGSTPKNASPRVGRTRAAPENESGEGMIE